MKKTIFFLVLLVTSMVAFSQNEKIPEGWDKIILEGEVAYMNLRTGDISSRLPKGPASKTKKINSYSASRSSSSGNIYYAKSGDTFSKIARENNISISELYSLNNLDNFDKLKVGQEVIIGDNRYSSGGYHVVETNETLYRISQNYDISVSKLKRLNSLDSNKIIIGQRLKIK